MDIPDNTDENPYQPPEEPEPATAEDATDPRKPWGFWATIGFSLIVLIAFFTIQKAVGSVFLLQQLLSILSDLPAGPGKPIQSYGFILSLATITSVIPSLGLIYLFVKLRKNWTAGEYLALRWPSWQGLLLWLTIIALFVAASQMLSLALGRELVSEFMVQVYSTAGFLPLLWLAVIVAAPVFEETFFRGFMLRGIAASPAGPVVAILITAIVWAAIHVQYDLYNMATIFIVGILFGIARLKTKSLATTIVLHGAMNLGATIEVAWHLA